MTAQLIDGNALAARIRGEVERRVAALRARGVTPGLAVILVGDDAASAVYVRNKVKACAEGGFHSVLEPYPATMTQAGLAALNSVASAIEVGLQNALPASWMRTGSRWAADIVSTSFRGLPTSSVRPRGLCTAFGKRFFTSLACSSLTRVASMHGDFLTP